MFYKRVKKRFRSKLKEMNTTRSKPEASKNNINVQESYRFRSLLEETTERLELLGLVTAATSKKLAKKREGEDSNVGNRKDILSLMVKQKELEQQFEHLMHKRWTLRGLSNKSTYLQNQAELKELAEKLRDSSSNISQNLKDHPTIVGNLNKIQKDRAELQDLLCKTHSELKQCQFDTLVTEVNTRTEQQRLLAETQKRQEQTAQALKALQTKLDEECERFDKEVDERNLAIAEKTARLKHLKKVTALRIRFEEDVAYARAETVNRDRKYKLDGLRNGMEEAKTGLEIDSFVSEQTRNFLGDELHGLEKLAQMWDEKYAVDIKAKTTEVDELIEKREADLLILNKYRDRWDMDVEEREALEAEEKQRQREAIARKRLLRVMQLAQCKIRFWWKVHQRHQGGKKKKKKGGGKKKKKK